MDLLEKLIKAKLLYNNLTQGLARVKQMNMNQILFTETNVNETVGVDKGKTYSQGSSSQRASYINVKNVKHTPYFSRLITEFI